MNTRKQGLWLCLCGVVLVSPDVLAVRLLQLDHGTLLFWRGVMLAIGFLAVTLVRYRANTLAAVTHSGWVGLGSALAFALSTFCFTQAMLLTSVTATMMLISTAPLFAALLGWVLLGERTPPRTLLTILVAFLGIAVIVSDNGGPNNLIGNLFALGTALFMSVNFTIARMAAPRDLSPSLMFGGLIATLLAYLQGAEVRLLSAEEFSIMLVAAAILMPVGFSLLQRAPRYIPATEVSLFLLLEAILGPFWVWLVLHEVPTYQTLLGSLIVSAALIGHSVIKRPGRKPNSTVPAGIEPDPS